MELVRDLYQQHDLSQLVSKLENLVIDEVFVFYDYPRVYTCRDQLGSIYLVVCALENDKENSWFYVPISDAKLRQLKAGSVTLRSAIQQPEVQTLLLTYISDISPTLKIYSNEELENLDGSLLPSAEFVLTEH